MPVMTIILDADDAWADLSGDGPHGLAPHVILADNDEPIQVGVLAAGMTSGKPSVMFRIHLPDGRIVLAETSLALFASAARAALARYPDTLA